MLAWVIVRLVRVETPVTSTSRAAVR
jgi:hypothetical protein